MFCAKALLTSSLFLGNLLLLATMGNSQAQGMKDFGNRVEGINVHLNALEDFTLIAVHRNFSTFSQNTNLKVRFFLPRLSGTRTRDTFVQAVELQDSFHYFMHSKTATWKDGTWNIFGDWPTKDVIDPLGLRADNIGILAGYEMEDGRTVYLPADVYASGTPRATQPYALHLVTGQDLQSIDISVFSAAGASVSRLQKTLQCNKKLSPNCRLCTAGSTQELDLDMAALPEGEYRVKLIGHVPGTSATTSLEIKLYHHP